MKKKITILLFATFCIIPIYSQTPLYKNQKAPVEDRVKDLVSKMTLDEKILQLSQSVLGHNDNINNIEKDDRKLNPVFGSFIYFDKDAIVRNAMQKKAINETRLGIPILFGHDVIHGFRTIFPIPLAQSCSWNPDLVTKANRVSAREAKSAGIDWTFSPMIDISHDARWGRIAETYGEDPYTTSVFGVAAVKGYQGKSLADSFSIAACLETFCWLWSF